MALTEKYDPDFERLWPAYPKWWKGRNRKHKAAMAFAKAKAALSFTPEDIDDIAHVIEVSKSGGEIKGRYISARASWQPGHRFGYQAMEVWINQRAWNDLDWETVQDTKPKPDRYDTTNREQDADRGMTDEQRAAARVAYEQYKADTRAVQ